MIRRKIRRGILGRTLSKRSSKNRLVRQSVPQESSFPSLLFVFILYFPSCSCRLLSREVRGWNFCVVQDQTWKWETEEDCMKTFSNRPSSGLGELMSLCVLLSFLFPSREGLSSLCFSSCLLSCHPFDVVYLLSVWVEEEDQERRRKTRTLGEEKRQEEEDIRKTWRRTRQEEEGSTRRWQDKVFLRCLRSKSAPSASSTFELS